MIFSRRKISRVPAKAHLVFHSFLAHSFKEVLYLPYWLTLETGQFLYGKAKRSFRDWPFVCFSGGFISHLFGDYANIIM